MSTTSSVNNNNINVYTGILNNTRIFLSQLKKVDNDNDGTKFEIELNSLAKSKKVNETVNLI